MHVVVGGEATSLSESIAGEGEGDVIYIYTIAGKGEGDVIYICTIVGEGECDVVNPSQMGASDVVVIYYYFFARVTVIMIFWAMTLLLDFMAPRSGPYDLYYWIHVSLDIVHT